MVAASLAQGMPLVALRNPWRTSPSWRRRSRRVLMSAQTLAILARVGRAPFVGRDEEFALLGSRLHTAIAPSGAVTVMSGELGVGKSRLAMEAASQ
jgi:Mrp family chromosome partitioning ATPase